MAGLYEISQVGKREDLLDYIVNVDMANTPFTTMARSGKPITNSFFSWQVDAYSAPRLDGVVDGKDVENFENMSNRELLHNYVQKVWRNPFVSDFAENVSDVAGLGQKREMAEQVRKALVVIKRDIESICLANTHEMQADNGTVPYQTRSLGRFIQTAAQSIFPVPAAFRTPAAQVNTTAVGSVTETVVQGVLKSRYQQAKAKEELDFFLGPDLKQQVDTFAAYAPAGTIPTRSWEQGPGRTVKMQVDIIDTSFALCRLHLSNFISLDEPTHSARRGFVLDMRNVWLRWNRKPRVTQLENKGGGPRAIVDAIFGLAVGNPLGHAKFAATS